MPTFIARFQTLLRVPVALALATAALLATSTGANAATQIGRTVDPGSSTCSPDRTWIQTVSPSGQYGLPADYDQYQIPFHGVITSWSFQAGSTAPSQIKLMVGALYGGTTPMVTVAEGETETPAPNTLNTFSSRIPAVESASIGFYFAAPNAVPCAKTSAPGYSDAFTSGDLTPVGWTTNFTVEQDVQLDVSAQLEPDADRDDFGDETQDQCLGIAGPQNGCTSDDPPVDPPVDPPFDPPATSTPTGQQAVTGQRAAALEKCKKKAKKKDWSKKQLKQCKRNANLLPV